MSSIYPYDSQEQDDGSLPEEVSASPSTVESRQEQQSPETLPSQGEEANGGPLGCCLGVTIGIVFSLVIGVVSRFYADPLASVLGSSLSITIRILMAVVGLVAAIVCGYFGWRIGKSIYREYDLKPAP